ncbi:extracellular solute-binding protein [Ktedonosporobacter rubrisoli]|uniref:Extracellular solute-binding protein n=1 Tax=Ktedonosporobacter rubrisoli TaxID=2509675 RepID=A0A4P6K3I6_KTERU|nr:extracellular solute-binding protein [Ktedonosporobacter rubrisoli]QBD82473.1 extracellular solute-binding protein [Ktedonosporobacter rubrisoli]
MKFFTRLSLFPALFVILLIFTSCGSTGSTPASTNASTPTSLTVYAALTEANGKLLAKAFESYAPGSKVTVVTGGTGALLTRIKAEKAAGSLHADVLLLADPTAMPGLDEQQILASYKPTNASQLPASFQDAHWSGAFSFNNVIIYHKGMSLPVPSSWQDLTSGKYQNQVELGDPAYSGTTLGMVGYLSQTYNWSYFSNLKKNNAITVQSTNTVGTDVAAGRVNIGITLDSVVRALLAKGSPIEVVWPSDGAIPVPAPVSIVAGHENALSHKFVDWLFSSGGQAAVEQLGYAPALGSSSMIPAHTKLASVDWSQIVQKRTSLLEQFHAIFAKAQ